MGVGTGWNPQFTAEWFGERIDMGKDRFLTLLLGVALGANVVIVAWIFNASASVNPVQGQTADSNGSFIAVTGEIIGRGDVLYLIDTTRRQLAVYQQGGQRLELLSSRNVTYDFKPPEYGRSPQEPTVAAMKKATKKISD